MKKLLALLIISAMSLSTFYAANIQSVYAGPPPGGYLDEMKYPNIIPPDFQFGTFGGIQNQLIDPTGVAVDSKQNILVSECGSNRVHVFDAAGKSEYYWGTTGSKESQFICPEGIAVGKDGNVYVSDTGNDRIQVFKANGTFLFQFGSHGYSNAQFEHPQGVAVDSNRIYVADSYNHRFQVFDNKGNFLFSVGSYGYTPGQFNHLSDVTVDEKGNIYAADSFNDRIQKFNSTGNLVKVWGDRGSFSGQFAEPTNVAYQGGQLYVEDTLNHRIQVFDTGGNFLYQWGRHPAVAHEGFGRMHYPTGLGVSPSGNSVVVCEEFENRCQSFSVSQVSSVRNVDDSAWWQKASNFHYGSGAAAGCRDTLFVTEPDTHFVVMFNISTDKPKFISSFGGYGRSPGQFINPTGASAKELPGGGCTLFASDPGNNRYQIINITSKDTPNIIAPKVDKVFSGGFGNKSAQFRGPGPSAMDKSGNIYVLDVHNARVQVFDPNFKFIRQWGEFGNKTGQFNTPLNIAIDPTGKIVYVVDTFNFRVQAFDTQGKYLYSWGTPGSGPSQFMSPFGITVDKEGAVYVTDITHDEVKKFDAKGNFITAWGQWGQGAGQFYKPKGISAWQNDQGQERIYVIDFGNHRGQIFTPDGKFVNYFGPLLANMTSTQANNVNPLEQAIHGQKSGV